MATGSDGKPRRHALMPGQQSPEMRIELARWASLWLEAARLQAMRVAEYPAGTVDIAAIADALQFVTACHKAAQAASAILGRDHQAVRSFSEAHAAKEIRDMLEHFDAYVTGGGELRTGRLADFAWKASIEQLVTTGANTVSATAVNAGGHQIIVESAITAVGELVEVALAQARTV